VAEAKDKCHTGREPITCMKSLMPICSPIRSGLSCCRVWTNVMLSCGLDGSRCPHGLKPRFRMSPAVPPLIPWLIREMLSPFVPGPPPSAALMNGSN
jgi:hypothetical protein